jgi:hypothetical protein
MDSKGQKKDTQIAQLDSNLDQAVRFSEDALEVLRRVNLLVGDSADKEVVDELAKNLNLATKELTELLSKIRKRTAVVHVACENAAALGISESDLSRLAALLNGRESATEQNDSIREGTESEGLEEPRSTRSEI